MKIIFTYFFILAFNVCNIFSQTLFDSTANELNKGFFLRTIAYGHVSSYNKSEHPNSLKIFKKQGKILFENYTPHESKSYVFIRFEKPEKIEIRKNKHIYIGKLFYSERLMYIEFNKHFKDSSRYDIDNIIKYKEGFSMAYKLFVPSEKKGENIYINIYPDYIMNVCAKNFHKDRKAPCTNLKEHQSKIFDAIKIDDYDYQQLNPFSDVIKNSNSKINYSKYIKTFWLENPNKIKLLYSKYADSYDRIDNINYTFDRIKYEYPVEIEEIAEQYPIENAVKDTIITSNEISGWIYAGKINKHLDWISDDNLVTLPNISEMKNGESLENLNIRETKPEPVENKYQKGKIKAVLKKGSKFNILEESYIPSIDGNLLLWLKINPL